MSDKLADLFGTNARPLYFAANSRYYGLETGTFETRNGDVVVYVRRRFRPDPEELVVVREHTVVDGDRPDNLAAKYLGDPEQFWRICDANNVMDPRELTETPGEKVRITLPEGMTGTA